MTLSRIFKTIFLVEFIKGLLMAIKEMFKKSKTLNYPFEKGPISPRKRRACFKKISKWRRKMYSL